MRTAELLGIGAGTTRVAISRMTTAGELETDGDRYRLASPALLARRSRQAQSRVGATRGWDGDWLIAVVDTDGSARPASERAELRAALTALRHAELHEGTWIRPDNLVPGVLTDAERIVGDRCHRFRGRPDGDPIGLARSLWPLDDWSSEALDLLEGLEALTRRLHDEDPSEALGDGFVFNAAVLRHLQSDPLLPGELLPGTWPGPRLRGSHAVFDQLFKQTLSDWLRATDAGAPTSGRTRSAS